MIPNKYSSILFGAILSGLMSFLVSGISAFRTMAPTTQFFSAWVSAWLIAWAIAFPVVLLAAPLTRKVVQLMVTKN